MRFRRSKYGAKKVKAAGITFDSKAEYARFCELQLLMKAGEINHLIVHDRLPLMVNDKNIGYYESDFSYIVGSGFRTGCQRTYEDVKGLRTPVYRLKKKILEANGIKITEIDAKDLKIRRR